ncbi:MAG TPA: UbiH/UbiF/VisC/COQ6 family ubiquinone biosynthesis hydroxylase [Caulobacteraceae bacterium]|jgi:2-octaprenyl-6-methoxyphenol hydroxylase
MSEPIRADVIVAGAGMAGGTAALALASGGLKVALIDALPVETRLAPAFDGRASAIAYSSFRMLKAIGVGARLEPVSCRIEQILVTDGRSPGAASGGTTPFHLRFAAEEIAARSEGEPLGYMVENRWIRASLAEAIAGSDIEVLAPARVETVEADARFARVRLADGRSVEAPLLVGAEGKNSVVREAAGIGVVGWSYGQSGVVATVKHGEPHGGVAHEYFLPGGPFAILPLTENRASLVWTEPNRRAEALRGASEAAFEAHLRRRFGDFLGEVSAEGPRFVYPLALQLAEGWTAPRMTLLGDAAHSIHPIAGQGLNLGLKDAAALAEVVVEAARLGEDIGSLAVLDRYARWRRFDTFALAASTDVFTRLFSNDNPVVRAARGLGMSVVNQIGPARRFFMQEAGGAVGDMPRLLRGEAL